MAGEAPHGGARAIKSPVGKGKNWEKFSAERILNIQSKLSVNSRWKPIWSGFIKTEFCNRQSNLSTSLN